MLFAVSKARRPDSQTWFVVGTSVVMPLVGAVYMYDLINVSRSAGGGDLDALFQISVSPRVGLCLGVLSFGAALILLVINIPRHQNRPV